LTPPFHTPPVTFDADGAPQSGDTLSPGASAKGKASNGHTSNGAAHASRSFHLVLIDNGRRAMRADRQLRETLYCIRCGACANVCANFQQVGGHAFGGTTYTGGIATGWEAGVHGLDAAASFNDLCTGCSRCVPACPVQIDIPWINVVVRDRIANGHDGAWRALPEGLRGEEAAQQEGASGEDGASARQAMQRRLIAHFGTLAKWGSRTAPVSNWVSQWAPARMLMERLLGIDRRRALPQFQRETLQDWMRRRLARNDAATHDAATPGSVTNGSASSGSALDRPRASRLAPPWSAAPDVVLYPDTYTNYVDTPRGQAAIRTLEALGVRVAVPDVPASGRAALSQGMIGVAEGQAQAVYEALDPYLRVGTPVIVIEPSDLAMFQGDYQRLLPDEAFAALSAKSVDLMAFIHDAIQDRLGDVWASHAGLSDKFVDPDSGASGGASVDSSGDGAEGQGEDQASPLPAAGVEKLTCGAGQAVTYHSHCQQRTLGLAEKTVALLDHLGYKVTTTTMECCGMAGSFGYKADYYELSMQIGQDLYREMTSEGRADAILVASGTSCQEQVEAFAGRRIPHPIELIAPAE
jgi:Fe-S oxidoreductase